MPEGLIPADMPTLAALGPVALVIALSALFRGFTGFGFAIIAVPLLSFALPPLLAVALAACLQFLGGLMDFRGAARACHWPSLRWLAAGAVLASPPGTLLLAGLPADLARLLIAAACAVAVLALVATPGLRRLPGPGATLAAGALAGLFNGMAAMPGPPALAYYLSLPLTPAQVRSSLMVFFLLSAGLSCASLVAIGAIGRREMLLALAGMPIMLAGSRFGAALFRRAGGAHRNVSLAALALVAALTAARGIAGLLGSAP
ncbi:sulfite exporter TauE/SafE family protein [Roseomonas nepalensis]|uniref:Probable membrane transporter protein n=1 Tax=Muricoccus nepalensis TaxID=1854500 RepID=A0A502G2K8_9PROT|nr:TSUP family transporter [Roseomonas nepalensis]TPG55466.1 sulfite exporter TauE/SafE family protein [Roseomonas nepalensis]